MSNIAGISNMNKSIFGMMPHPERSPDAKYFIKAIEKFAGTICCRTKTLGLILLNSYLGGKKIGSAIRIKMQAKPLFRSHTLKAEDIDSLYSEFFVLNF